MSIPVLHGPGFSTYVRTARLALEEKGVDYEMDEFNFLADGMPAEQLARHPFGKVPAFTHNGFTLYETGAIGRYVDEAFDGPALQPANAQGRARLTQVCGVLDSYAYGPAIGTIVIQRMIVPMMGGAPDTEAIEAAAPDAKKAFGVLDDILGERSHLVGDSISLADLHLAPIYDYFRQTPEGEEILGSTPALSRWWNGVSGRDSMARTTPQLG